MTEDRNTTLSTLGEVLDRVLEQAEKIKEAPPFRVLVQAARTSEARYRLRVQRMIIVDSLERAKPFDAVDVLNTFRDQTVPLAVQPTRVLCSNAGHLHHAPHFRLAAQIRHQRA